MKLLMQLGLGNFGKFRPLRCRRSIHQRSIHGVPSFGHTDENQIHRREHSSGYSPSAFHPRWAMLNPYIHVPQGSVADARTVADAETETSRGRHLRVSLGLESPPASSYLYFDMEPDDAPTDVDDNDAKGWRLSQRQRREDRAQIIAAHGDAMLLEMTNNGYPSTKHDYVDYFVYRASAGRAPSLSLLPIRDVAMKCEEWMRAWDSSELMLHEEGTGLLRRSDDELLVVLLGVPYRGDSADHVELCVLHVDRPQNPQWPRKEWEIKRHVPLLLDEGSRGNELRRWRYSSSVVPVGDRFLCWVNYADGFLFSDVASASPAVRYVPLPVETLPWRSANDPDAEVQEEHMQWYRNMCPAGGDTVRFVTIEPRCCCGSTREYGTSLCAHSRFTFRVVSWTLRLGMDEPMRWVWEGALDCEELWALPGYEGLPRVIPMYPVVSPDNPNIVILTVSEQSISYPDREVWRIEVDTWSKQLLSILRTSDRNGNTHFPIQFQC